MALGDKVPNLASIVSDIEHRLQLDGINPADPRYNSLFALYLYTIGYHTNPPNQQFYSVMNRALRERTPANPVLPWLPILYYMKVARVRAP